MKYMFLLIVITFCLNCFSQDGSDIWYLKFDELDSSFVNKFCHVDFGDRSFRGLNVDTIEITVKGEFYRFVERRKDNGYDNWFNEQYLEMIPTAENYSARLQSSKIDSISSNKLFLTSILSYYSNESPLDTITIFQHAFNQEDIFEVLIKAD